LEKLLLAAPLGLWFTLCIFSQRDALGCLCSRFQRSTGGNFLSCNAKRPNQLGIPQLQITTGRAKFLEKNAVLAAAPNKLDCPGKLRNLSGTPQLR
jgi:hypothetical protein